MNNLNKSITGNETKFVIKSPLQRKALDQMDLLLKSSRLSKRSIVANLIQKNVNTVYTPGNLYFQ